MFGHFLTVTLEIASITMNEPRISAARAGRALTLAGRWRVGCPLRFHGAWHERSGDHEGVSLPCWPPFPTGGL